jgi:phenylacetate-CoA ligase
LPDLQRAVDVPFESPERIAACTDRLLGQHVQYCYEHSRFYRQRFESAGLRPEDIRGVADLGRLPFTTKADLAEHARDLLCVPEHQVVDICQTSGTTGTPVALLQTERDLHAAYGSNCVFRRGLTPEDRVVVACALDRCFMAGLAYFEGLRRIGATAIRAGAASPSVIAEAVLTYKPSAIIGVPSILLETGRVLQRRGVDPSQLGIGRLICIGEPVRDADLSPSGLGARLNRVWRAQVLSTYASTEMATTFAECAQGRGGGHIHPDQIAVEIVDEAAGRYHRGRQAKSWPRPCR